MANDDGTVSVRPVTIRPRAIEDIEQCAAYLEEHAAPEVALRFRSAIMQAVAQIEAMPDVHKFPFDIAVSFEQQGKSANQVADPDQRKAAQQVFQQAMNDRARQAAARMPAVAAMGCD